MSNYLPKPGNGISLLEMLLVLMLIAAGILVGFSQYSQYKRSKDITQIQQSVNQLSQAGSAYYYALCSASFLADVPQQASLAGLQAMGLIANTQAIYNPWGIQPFEVWI